MGLEKLRAFTLNTQLSDIAKLKYYNDFFKDGASTAPWVIGAVATGTIGNSTGESKHPGVMSYVSHATNVNSGYRAYFESTSILISGGEKSTIIFKTGITTTGVTRYIGFQDTSNQSLPVDGAFLCQIDTTLTGKTAKATAISTTGTSYTLSPSTWYRGVITVNSDATSVLFELYADDSTTLLWSATLTTNIPIATTSHGDLAIIADPTGSARTIGYIDYMDIVLPNSRRIV